MPFSNALKSCSEENIPLIFQDSSEEHKNKKHRITKSNLDTKSIWNAEAEDDFGKETEVRDKTKINNLQGIIHLIKCNIGSGVLSLPSAFRYSGYVLGPLVLLILSLTSMYCMHLLVEVIEYLRNIHDTVIDDLDYEKTVELCFLRSTKRLRKFSWIHHVLYCCILVCQIGFLSSYHIFIAENTKSLVDYYVSDKKYIFPIWEYQLIFFLLLAPVLYFKNLNQLSYICQFANVLMFVSLGTSTVYCLIGPLPINELHSVRMSNSTLLSFGIIVFAFESINLLNYIENNLKNKKDLGKKCGVINISSSFVIPFYLIVGISGYIKFGDNISSSIILSLPNEPWYIMLCKPFYILSLLISYGLQGFVLHGIFWKKIKDKLVSEKKRLIADTIIRIGIVLATTLLSISIPHLDLFVSLIGAVSGGVLIFIFPPICKSVMIFTKGHEKFWKIKIIINGLLIVLGLIGSGVGTYTSLNSIIKVEN